MDAFVSFVLLFLQVEQSHIALGESKDDPVASWQKVKAAQGVTITLEFMHS